MNKILTINGLSIGSGMPKVVVPIVAKSYQEIISDTKTIADSKPDLVEWRADFFDEVLNLDKLIETLHAVHEILRGIPIIFTIRTSNEGGNLEIDTESYTKLLASVASDGAAELIDIELFQISDADFIDQIHQLGSKVILSNHDFHQTPDKIEIISRLLKMQEFGGDLLKIAVMPNSISDVVTLLDATSEVANNSIVNPLVTMAMGPLGAITRVSGEYFGSALTFASVGKTSAPGQMPIGALRICLEVLHESIHPELTG